MKKYSFAVIPVIVILAIFASACSSNSDSQAQVLLVESGTSIQKVIDVARKGDLILIEQGTYNGEIVVNTADITIRGMDRNNVVIDGKYEQDNGIVVSADGVRVENLTVQRFRTNGVLIAGGYGGDTEIGPETIISRYLVDYVNAMNNGLYGIYAFGSQDGIISNTFSRANADAGIYVGQCKPCKVQVFNNIAYNNGLGFQGANSSEEVYIFNNNFSDNRTGIHILSETKERLSPQTNAIIIGNRTDNNNLADAPTTTPDLFGFGIIIVGGENNIVDRNRADGNAQAGIVITSTNDFISKNNQIITNAAVGNGIPFGFDLAYLFEGKTSIEKNGNCFSDNSFSSGSIDRIEEIMNCQSNASDTVTIKALRPYQVPNAPQYNELKVEPQERENKPGDLRRIPKKLESIKYINLDDLGIPDANNGL